MPSMMLLLIIRFVLWAFADSAYATASSTPEHISIALSGLRTIDNNPLRSILERAQADAVHFGKATEMAMHYGIFEGKAAIRTLSDSDMDLMKPSKYGIFNARNSNAFHLAAACLLLMRGNLEASHEVVLGVTPTNIGEAEYAATHPGKTKWAEEHPLSDSADLIHSIIHRLEGTSIGEGNHTGYDNSKYWALGGPKKLKFPASHPVRDALAKRAKKCAPYCLRRGVVAVSDTTHRIIAGGGERRTVHIKPGEWDDIAFTDICRMRANGELTHEESIEVQDLQSAELACMLKHELIKAGFGDEIEAGEVK